MDGRSWPTWLDKRATSRWQVAIGGGRGPEDPEVTDWVDLDLGLFDSLV